MTACVLDTDVVIAALDRADAHHLASAAALRAMIDDNVPLLLSLINYAETLVRPADNASALRTAVAAIDALGIQLNTPYPADRSRRRAAAGAQRQPRRRVRPRDRARQRRERRVIRSVRSSRP